MFRFKNPKRGMAVTALAGPASNLMICVVFLFLYGLLYMPLRVKASLGTAGATILEMIYLTALISLGMGIFNLLPIPPLDGSKVLYSVLSDRAYLQLMRYERFGVIALWLLVWSGMLGSPLSSATGWVFDKLFAVAELAFNLSRKLF
jgi:Zn-dependent protease